MLTSRNNEPRWILATIINFQNRQFWGWHKLCFVRRFLLLFFLRTWNQTSFFCLRAGKFSSAAPTYGRASTVDKTFEELSGRIQDNVQENIDHHKILAEWCLSLSQHILIIYTKVCDVFSTKLPVRIFGDLLAKIGLDASDHRLFDQCVGHKSPDSDLYGF